MQRFLILVALIMFASDSLAAEKVVKVFVLAGQSNMEGQGVVDLDHPDHYNGGKGTLVWSMKKCKNKSEDVTPERRGGELESAG